MNLSEVLERAEPALYMATFFLGVYFGRYL